MPTGLPIEGFADSAAIEDLLDGPSSPEAVHTNLIVASVVAYIGSGISGLGVSGAHHRETGAVGVILDVDAAPLKLQALQRLEEGVRVHPVRRRVRGLAADDGSILCGLGPEVGLHTRRRDACGEIWQREAEGGQLEEVSHVQSWLGDVDRRGKGEPFNSADVVDDDTGEVDALGVLAGTGGRGERSSGELKESDDEGQEEIETRHGERGVVLW